MGLGAMRLAFRPMAQLQLRPYSLGGIVDASLTLYRRRFGPMIAVTLAIGLIPFVVSLVGGCTTTASQTTCDSPIGWLGNIAFQVALFVATSAAVLVAANAFADLSSDWRQVASTGLRRIIPIVLLIVVMLIIMIVGFVLLVIPGIILAVSFAVAVPALMIEKSGPIESLGRSWRLVSGERWRIFGAGVVLILVLAVGLGVVWGIVSWVLSSLEMSGALAAYLAQGVVSMLATPMSAAVGTVLYCDLRVRKEDLDVAELRSLLSRER